MTADTNEIFLSQLKDIFIPSIENMIIKEKEHIKKMESMKVFKWTNNDLVETFILDSRDRLAHYEQRLKEYNNYQLTLTK